MPKKRQREAEIVKGYEEFLDNKINEEIIQSKDDNDLFIIDRIGSKNTRKKIKKEEKIQKDLNIISKVERKLIEKKLQDINNNNENNSNEKKKKKEKIIDLWDNDESISTKSTKSNNKTKHIKKALKVPLPGISYNPAHLDHQDALAEALAITLRHEEEKVRKSLNFSSPTTTSAITSTTESEQNDNIGSDSESENENNNSLQLPKKHRLPQKKTRAQRNKEKNRKLLRYQKAMQLKEQRLLNSINKIPKHLSAIEKKIEENEIKKKSIELLKKETEERLAKEMTYNDAGAVPLTEELNGSLRCIKPLGLAVSQQSIAMRAVGNINDRMKARNRKKGEKLHPQKRVKWIPKYKYKETSN